MLWRGPVRPVCRALRVSRKERPVLWADGRYVAARGREGRGRTLARVAGRGASLEGDQVCAARERAVTQQPPDGGGVNVVGPRNISLRLASSEAPHGFLALMRRHLARAAEPNAPLLRSPAALARPRPD
jgi:hypothetical protein